MHLDIIILMKYYPPMRRGIDYIGVGAGAVIFNNEGKIFLALRGAKARNEKHTWEFPGGCVEFGETLEKALIREIKEEYGFTIKVVKLLDVINHILPGEKQHWVSPTYLCMYQKGKPSILEPHKCDEIGWFDLDRVPISRLSQASRQSLKSLKRYLSNHV
jgi:mutator protein MutT